MQLQEMDVARYDANDGNMDFKPLYDTILKEVPKPQGADENGLQLTSIYTRL